MSVTYRQVKNATNFLIAGAIANGNDGELFDTLSAILQEVEDWSENFSDSDLAEWKARLAEVRGRLA